MKKTPLLAATAVLTVLLATGFAQAKTATETTAAPATAPAATMRGLDKPMRGPMMGMPKLSEASQKMMQESMNKVREENKATFEEMEAKHKELQEIMKAPSFDKTAFLAKHEELRTLREKLESSRLDAMANVMEKMSSEDRAQMGGMGMMDGRGMGKGMRHMGKMGDCPMMGASDEAPAKPAVGSKK